MSEKLSSLETSRDKFEDYPESIQKATSYIATSMQIADRTMRMAHARHEPDSENYKKLLQNASAHEGNAQAAAYVLDCVLPLPEGRNWINEVSSELDSYADAQVANDLSDPKS